jgi:tetratricopeptide (TPR) repeat protein
MCHPAFALAVVTVFVVADPAFAAGSGSVSTPAASMPAAPAASPAEQARSAHNAGVKLLKKAEGAAPEKAEKAYRKALEKFEQAMQLDGELADSWNYVGYCRRKLGEHDGALIAYDRALALRPDFAEALEYRAQAYLGVGRIEEARNDYLAVFAKDRAMSAQLLEKMRAWVDAQRAAPGPLSATDLDAFAAWIDERAQIAAQTASLGRDAAPSAWR